MCAIRPISSIVASSEHARRHSVRVSAINWLLKSSGYLRTSVIAVLVTCRPLKSYLPFNDDVSV